MKKIFTLVSCVLFGAMAMAQAPEAVIKKTSVAPVVDGVMDGIWLGANVYNIVTPLKSEVTTLGAEGTTTWRALWSDEGIYILLKVNDDVWMPDYLSLKANYDSDKPEIYFDVNAVKLDGNGPNPNVAEKPSAGHYQFAPGTLEADIFGTPKTDADGVVDAYMVTASTYLVEYFVPFSKLKDNAGAALDLTAPIGFDVTIIDLDDAAETRQRVNWSNNASIDESWSNMDGCGTVTLSEEIAVGGGLISKTETAPVIDGEVDAVWANAAIYNIATPFKEEVATVGDLGETTWKALWNADGMYVLVEVADDNWFPNWAPGGGANDYDYDKIELYFDTNLPRLDATGGHTDTPGSIQIAPGSADGKLDGTMLIGTAFGLEFNYAIKVSDPSYVAEYFIPWDILNDKDVVAFDKTTSMGFDVTVVDRDSGDAARKRINWSNAGAIDESWANMDDAGIIMFDGATELIYVDKITVSGGNTITTEGGTLQMVAAIEPIDATAQKPKWVIENGTGEAKISKDGLLTAIKDGTVLVKAMATDGSYAEGKVTVTISNQTFNKDDIWNTFNKITNWSFENGQTGQFPVSWGGWIDRPVKMLVGTDSIPSGLTEQGDPVIEEGVCVMQAGLAADNAAWHYQVNQSPLSCEPNVPYTLKFKTWATADATPCVVDFESNAAAETGEQYNRYGASSDAEAVGGRGEWNYVANIEPRWVEFHVIFDQINEGITIQKIQWMFSLSNETISMDSVLLIKDADILLKVPTLSTAASKVQLYPNPAQNELTVSKIAVANSKVSVYNAVGQKLMEKTATGNQAKFDVASLRKGMYFVRFTDGSSQKFIKD